MRRPQDGVGPREESRMQSPFQIFRKHQKMLIVVLTGLAMFAFILLDSVQNLSSVPPTLMVFIGAVLLGGAFWIFGLQGGKGKQVEFGLTGAVVGVAIGLAFMFFSRPRPVVETSVGKISAKELREMVDRRNVAVRFMRNAFQSSVPAPPQPAMGMDQIRGFVQQNPQIASAPFIQQMIRQNQAVDRWQEQQFKATFPLEPIELSRRDRMTTERDAVLRFLLLKEAREMGIEVNNDAVNEYIKRVTNDQMSQAIFNNIRNEMQVSKAKLYDILREEIAAQIVLRLQRPEHMRIVTPGEYWKQYRKLNIRQKMEFVPVEVKDFMFRVSEPPEQELRAFFDKYKDKAPSGLASADPAFGLPERIQMAYFKADYEAVENDVLKRLDREYLSTKEIASALEAIDQAVADVQQRIKEGTIKKELAEKEQINARQEHLRKLLTSGNKVRRFDFEIVKRYEDRKTVDYQNPAWKAPHPGGPAKKDPFPPDENDFPPKKPAGVKPDAKKKPAAKSDETKAKKTPAKSPKNAKTDDSGALHWPAGPLFGPTAFTALLTQPAKTAAASKENPPAKKPVAAERPGTKRGGFPELPPPPALPEGPPPPPFREFNEDLRNRIRDDLLKEKVQSEIRVRLQKAAAAMEAYRTKYLAWLENPQREFDRVVVSAALRKKAKELGLEYVVTRLFGQLEFVRDAAEFPMNDAARVFDLAETGFRRQQLRRINEVLFPRGDENEKQRATSLYSVILAKEFKGQEAFQIPGDMYVLWKTAYEGPKTPKFEDEGIREKVLKAWREVQARPLAETRAKEIATLVREAKRSMEDVLEGKTITGTPDGPPLLPQRIGESFTWLTTDPRSVDSTAPPLGIEQIRFPIAPAEIKGVQKAGNEFREYIFDTLKDGDVGVTPNADKSIYYVVRVLERQGDSREGRKYHIQQLLDSQPTAEQSELYGPLKWVLNPINRSLLDETVDRLYKKYDVKFNRRLDKEDRDEG
jgi:hypothetical protein